MDLLSRSPRRVITSASSLRRFTVALAAVALAFAGARSAQAQRTARPTVPARTARGPIVASTTPTTQDDARDTASAMNGISNGDVAPAAERKTKTTHYRSIRDSIAGVQAERAVTRARGMRVAVSLEDRVLHVLDGDDTLLVAAIATGMDTTITFGRQSWTFQTPRGRRTVLGKQEKPVWIPPEWHYAETAKNMGLKLAHMPEKGTVPIGKGRLLAVHGGKAGVIGPDRIFEELPVDEEIIFNNTLYIPPGNTENRKIDGELGRFRLALGDGYYFHGTPHEDTIGDAATHGCIRLYDEDIEWLYQHVPVGTPVFIY